MKNCNYYKSGGLYIGLFPQPLTNPITSHVRKSPHMSKTHERNCESCARATRPQTGHVYKTKYALQGTLLAQPIITSHVRKSPHMSKTHDRNCESCAKVK